MITHARASDDAFSQGLGHAPQAREDAEYVYLSPTDEFARVISRIKAKESGLIQVLYSRARDAA